MKRIPLPSKPNRGGCEKPIRTKPQEEPIYVPEEDPEELPVEEPEREPEKVRVR